MRTPTRVLLGAALPAVPLLLYALALRGAGAPGEGAAPLAAHPPSERSGVSCSVPAGRQIGAVRAFREMARTFRHPRCFNCHGNYDIMSEAHPGYEESREARDSTGGRNPLVDLLSVEERITFHRGCGSPCHDNISGRGVRPTLEDSTRSVSGWMLAPLPMQWVGKDDEELCRLVKRFERDGSQFLDHVVNDHEEVQFIEVAFNGDRALGPDGLRDYSLTAAPPPGGVEGLFGHARRWVSLMGAEHGWVGDPDCGCVMPELELTVRMEVAVNVSGAASRGRMTATVPLTADSSGLVYHGEAPLRPGAYEMSHPPAPCTVSYAYTDGTLAVPEARLDATEDGRLSVELLVQPAGTQVMMRVACANQPVPLEVPADVLFGQWIALHHSDRVGMGYRFAEFETPAEAPSADGRALVARKEVDRTFQAPDGTVSATTVFELWAVPDAPE